MKKVICDGAVTDSANHKCEERKCKHRKLHKPMKGRCGIRNHNNSDGWCSHPGTQSLIDMGEEGNCVTCMTEAQIRKEELKLNKDMLKDFEEQRKKLIETIGQEQASLENLDRHIKILRSKK